MTKLKEDGFPVEDLDVYSGSPFPEGSFGEHEPEMRLYMFPLVGRAGRIRHRPAVDGRYADLLPAGHRRQAAAQHPAP